jgi:acid phosphatase
MKGKRVALLALVAGALALFSVHAVSAAQPLKRKPPKPHVTKKVKKAKAKKHKKAPVPSAAQKLSKINHIVVIYEENHSFDNLYGGWEGVNGLSQATPARMTQVNQAGVPFTCLLQNDVNLATPPLTPTCTDSTTPTTFASHFTNTPFKIDDYIKPSDTTCPPPGVFAANGVVKGSGVAGGCTRDIVHRFYQEQYQLNGGAMNRYTVGSDAVGLTQGYYDTKALPVYQYLHQPAHPHYVIADNFFQAAFGGSFLNHQWLVAAQTPVFANAPQSGADDLHSIVDTNGMPVTYPLYTPTTATVKDSSLTVKCTSPVPNLACGDYAVNTTQPFYKPYSPGTPDARRLPPLTSPNIGDELSAKNVSWAWYSGGWSNANGDVGAPGWTNGNNGTSCIDVNADTRLGYPNCPDKNFQYHHQAFNYWATYAPGTQARKDHLRDEAEFISAAKASTKSCSLRSVSFIKPLGEENEHPGYASESIGSSHLVELLKAISGSACAKDTMVVVTYDEFGGQWDHVPPPGQGSTTPGPHDQWGPGTRIPALVFSPYLPASTAVDHTSHDTTSILATIEHRFGVAALSSRDQSVADLRSVFTAK